MMMKQWNRWRPNVVVERNIDDVIETTWHNPVYNAAIKSGSTWSAAGFLVIHGKPRAVTLRGGGKIYPLIFDETDTKKWSPQEHLRAVDTYKREGEVFVHPSVLGYGGDEGELREEWNRVHNYYDRAKEGKDYVFHSFDGSTDTSGRLYAHTHTAESLVKLLEIDVIMQPTMRDLLSRLEQMKMKASNGDLKGIDRLIMGLAKHVSEVAQRKEKICELRRERKGMAA